MGFELERMATRAYDRRQEAQGLPLVQSWGRWEGVDRDRRSLEIDLVAPLLGGGVLTGAVKWERAPVGPKVHEQHLEMLRRAADAGRKWAHLALAPDAPLLYVAAGGFNKAFKAAVKASGRRAICWSLEDLYAA